MFEAEVDLAEPVRRWLVDNGATCVAEEVAIGAGIPDMIGGFGLRNELRNRRRQADPVVLPVQLSLLDFCRRARTLDELRAWAPNGFSSLNSRAIQPLLERKILKETSQGIKTQRHPRDPFSELIAIELKLTASARGFAQAFSYRLFADKAYLAVPARKVTPRAMDRARELGVGLLAVHAHTCDEAVEPSSQTTHSQGRRRMLTELLLAASQDPMARRAGSPAQNLAIS